MPWEISDSAPGCDGFAVVKKDGGKVVGCHSTQSDAQNQLKALYANVENSVELADASGLIAWFNDGADGKIDWGEHGAFAACVAIAGDHMDDDQAKGFCAERHHDATGEWPGAKKELAARIQALEAAVISLFELG